MGQARRLASPFFECRAVFRQASEPPEQQLDLPEVALLSWSRCVIYQTFVSTSHRWDLLLCRFEACLSPSALLGSLAFHFQRVFALP